MGELTCSTTNVEGAGLDFHEVRPAPLFLRCSLSFAVVHLSAATDLQFHLTNNDTALCLVYNAEPYDLSSYNVTTEDGSQGYILNNYVQEIEIETGTCLSPIVGAPIIHGRGVRRASRGRLGGVRVGLSCTSLLSAPSLSLC